MLRFAQHDRKRRAQNDKMKPVILNPSTVLRVNSVKDLLYFLTTLTSTATAPSPSRRTISGLISKSETNER